MRNDERYKSLLAHVNALKLRQKIEIFFRGEKISRLKGLPFRDRGGKMTKEKERKRKGRLEWEGVREVT